jgi:predicted glycosyltransferase
MRGKRTLGRILVYTHNSIGLGHAVRTMAVIDGVRRVNPDTDWLTLSGTSAPQVFLAEGIETVKLPGIRHDLEASGQPYRPRLLKSFSRDEVLAWRRRLIAECLASFRPDVVMVEHSLAGLMGEAAPILAARAAQGPKVGGFALIHLSRGIYRSTPRLLAPPGDYPGLAPGTNVAHLYDALYVFEDRHLVDVNREFFGNDPVLKPKIHYLGRISSRNADEFGRRGRVAAALDITDKPFVLLALGRHGRVVDLHATLFAACRRLGLFDGHDVVVVPDPYLPSEALAAIQTLPDAGRVRFAPFLPHLAELMAEAALTACRAGYNMVNEVLVSGVKALIIPETHPSGEQERRAATIPTDNVMILGEAQCFEDDLASRLAALLRRPSVSLPMNFDRFRLGRVIAHDLERILSSGA